MKFLRMNFIACILLVSILFTSKNVVFAVDSNENKTEVEVRLSKPKNEDNGDSDDSKETIYTPEEAIPLRVLPNTGEIITSFLFVLLGISIIMFLFGIFISRITQNDIRWDY